VVVALLGISLGIAIVHTWGTRMGADERIYSFVYAIIALFNLLIGIAVLCREYTKVPGELFGVIAFFCAIVTLIASGFFFYHLAYRQSLFAASNLTIAFLALKTFATMVAYARPRPEDESLRDAWHGVSTFFGWIALGPLAVMVVLLLVEGIIALKKRIKSA
jgi:hypothetical protein